MKQSTSSKHMQMITFGPIFKVIKCLSILQREGVAAVELTEINSLEPFILGNVEVSILDEDGDEKAPFVKKEIIKTELCPDMTHLRLYFDRLQFFAVPLTAEVAISDDSWSAFDGQAGLTYVVKRVRG